MTFITQIVITHLYVLTFLILIWTTSMVSTLFTLLFVGIHMLIAWQIINFIKRKNLPLKMEEWI